MEPSKSRRKIDSVILGCVLLVLLIGFVALNAFNFKFFNSATTGEIVVFTGLSILAFMLLMAGLVLLVRNVLKLYADQRNSVMGTRLRTRMLWGAVLVSIIPLVFMFLFSFVLMNRAVDRWFEKNPDEIRNDSNSLALELAQYTSANARVEAESIAQSLPALDSAASPRVRSVATHQVAASAAIQDNIDHVLQQHNYPAERIRRRLSRRTSHCFAQHAKELGPACTGKVMAPGPDTASRGGCRHCSDRCAAECSRRPYCLRFHRRCDSRCLSAERSAYPLPGQYRLCARRGCIEAGWHRSSRATHARRNVRLCDALPDGCG